MNKIKLTISALLVVLSVGAAMAQASVSLGLKGGLNFANVNASSVGAAYDSRTGYHLGAFLNAKFTKFAIQPEIIYSRQGSSVSFSGSTTNYELDYINIPILLKFYLVAGLNLQAGPQFGFLTSAVAGGVDVKNQFKTSDTSIALGAGFDISKFCIDARYNLGLSEINDGAASSAAKNQVFQLSIGYKFFKLGN